MKKKIAIFIMLLGGLLNAQLSMAQQRGKFNPQEFKAKLESYVTQEAGFTTAEAQAFYPIYFEMKAKQRQLQRSIYKLKKNAPQADADDKDFAIAIQKIKDLGVEMAQLEVSYYKKLCTAVSPAKVYRAMCAEDRFHRKMLEDFGGEQNRQGNNKPK